MCKFICLNIIILVKIHPNQEIHSRQNVFKYNNFSQDTPKSGNT